MSAKPAKERDTTPPPRQYSIDGDYSGHQTGADPALKEPMPLPQDYAEMLNVLAKKSVPEVILEQYHDPELLDTDYIVENKKEKRDYTGARTSVPILKEIIELKLISRRRS